MNIAYSAFTHIFSFVFFSCFVSLLLHSLLPFSSHHIVISSFSSYLFSALSVFPESQSPLLTGLPSYVWGFSVGHSSFFRPLHISADTDYIVSFLSYIVSFIFLHCLTEFLHRLASVIPHIPPCHFFFSFCSFSFVISPPYIKCSEFFSITTSHIHSFLTTDITVSSLLLHSHWLFTVPHSVGSGSCFFSFSILLQFIKIRHIFSAYTVIYYTIMSVFPLYLTLSSFLFFFRRLHVYYAFIVWYHVITYCIFIRLFIDCLLFSLFIIIFRHINCSLSVFHFLCFLPWVHFSSILYAHVRFSHFMILSSLLPTLFPA